MGNLDKVSIWLNRGVQRWNSFVSVAETALVLGLLGWAYSAAADPMVMWPVLFFAWFFAAIRIATTAEIARPRTKGWLIAAAAVLIVSFGVFLRFHVAPPTPVASRGQQLHYPTPAQIASEVQKREQKGLFAHLKTTLFIDSIRPRETYFHFVVLNLGPFNVAIKTLSYSTNGMEYREDKSMIARALAPGATVQVQGFTPQNIHELKDAISLEVNYQSLGGGKPDLFTSHSKFMFSVPAPSLGIDPFTVGETALNDPGSPPSQAPRILSGNVGTVMLVFDDSHANGTPNVSHFHTKAIDFTFNAASSDAILTVFFLSGESRTISGKLPLQMNHKHTITLEWDRAAKTAGLGIDSLPMKYQ